MKRSVYEAPTVERIQIRMEGGFCSGSAEVRNPDAETGRIDNQSLNNDFTSDYEGTWE